METTASIPGNPAERAPTSVLTAKDMIARHVGWKLTLQYAIVAQEPLSEKLLDQILHVDRCPIGQWLAAATAQLRDRPEYREVVRNHIDFHRQMTHIANLIEQQEFDRAAREIEPGSAFMISAHRLAMSITALDRTEKIQISI